MHAAIVEDVPEMLELVRLALSEIPQIEVRSTSESVPAFRKVLLTKRPDIVFLDEVLPGESGLDLLPELRVLGVKVILMTGMDPKTRPKGFLPSGALGRVYKPTGRSTDEFVNEIRKVLGL